MAVTIRSPLEEFLRPLAIDANVVHELSRELAETFKRLSAESLDMFLPTPISESILRPVAGRSHGRYLAMDIGGTNLRVGFVELLGDQHVSMSNGAASYVNGFDVDSNHNVAAPEHDAPLPGLHRILEQSWPIHEHLKNENPEKLFSWIGQNVAGVVRRGMSAGLVGAGIDLPVGVTFSFPMVQRSLSEAMLMDMGKGFAITSKLNLGEHLLSGYEKHRVHGMPRIRVAAIANDAVSTLVSFVYQFAATADRRAAMGLIVGTGSNATIPLRLSSLHPSKRPETVSILPGREDADDVRIAVNTEWSINGSAPPLRKMGLVSRWDKQLDEAGERPGFQPLEYMTAGRYLGELGRITFLDYLETIGGVSTKNLPKSLHTRFGLTTTFLSHLSPGSERGPPLKQLMEEFPLCKEAQGFQWTQEHADALHMIAKAIELRAAGITAASTVALLACAGDIPHHSAAPYTNGSSVKETELAVGYTGGCIAHFQDYLVDCQRFIDEIMHLEFAGHPPVRIVLSPCHDGGITGAGILVPAALASRHQ